MASVLNKVTLKYIQFNGVKYHNEGENNLFTGTTD